MYDIRCKVNYAANRTHQRSKDRGPRAAISVFRAWVFHYSSLIYCYMRQAIDMNKASAEMRFLLSCMRRKDQRAEVSPPAGIGWDSFIKLTRAHRCVPQAYGYMLALESGSIPGPVLESMRKLTAKIAVCNVVVTGALFGIQDLFVKNDIRVTCIKGPALSMLAYGNTSMRQFGDLDLVVYEQDRPRAVELLLAEGYELRELSACENLGAFLRTGQAVTLQNRDRTVYLDLSSVPISHLMTTSGLTERVISGSARVEVDDDRSILSPGAELMMMLVCMHGAEDMWNKLSEVADVKALLERRADADWAGLLETAAEWGQRRSVLVGMGVAQKLLSADIPAELSEALLRDPAAVALADEVAQGIVSGRSLNAGLLRAKRFEYATRDRAVDRLRWVIRQVFVPGAVEFNSIAFPQWLSFMYYILRPIRLMGKMLGRGERSDQFTVGSHCVR